MFLKWILASLGLRTGIPLCVFSRQTPLFHFAQSEWVEDHLFVTSTSFALKGDECSGGLKRKNKHFLAFFHFPSLCANVDGTMSASRKGQTLRHAQWKAVCRTCWTLKTRDAVLRKMIGGAGWGNVDWVLLLLLPPKKNKTKKTSFCQHCFFFNSIYCEMLTIPQVLFCQLKLQTEEESRSSSTFTAVSSLLTVGFLCIVTWSQFIGRVHVCYP